jgi:hypothetical protein
MLINNLDYLESEFGMTVSGKGKRMPPGNAYAYSTSFADAIGPSPYTSTSVLVAVTTYPGFPSTSTSGASATAISNYKPSY